MLKKHLLLLVVLVLTLVGLSFPHSALAQATPQLPPDARAWTGKCTDTGTPDGVATIQGLECLVANVLTVAMTLIGLAGFAMIIIGSFTYLVSGGNTKGIESARNTISFVVVGIVVALSAFIILNLITAFTGVGIIQQFRIPDSSDGL